MGFLDKIHEREEAEARTVETPKAEPPKEEPKVETPVETPKEEPPKEEPQKVDDKPVETPVETKVETPVETSTEQPPKEKKDLSNLSKEEKAAFAFRKQLAKRESKFEEALKSRDAEIESLKKSIEELKSPKQVKKRKDFETDDEYINYLAADRVDEVLKQRDAKAAEEKAKADQAAKEEQEENERRQEAINGFQESVKEAFTDEAQATTFRKNIATATKNGLGELLDSVPPVRTFLLENGTTGVRVLDKILSDRNTFGRVFKPNNDPVSMLIELHAIAHEVNDVSQNVSHNVSQNVSQAEAHTQTSTEVTPKKQAIGRPGQGGQGGAPGELHGRDLILHMRKVAQGGRRL